MSDLVVTCPASFWPEWLAEGDPAGDPESGEEWGFAFGRAPAVAPIAAGERLYVVAHGRRGGAVAVTVAEEIPGFRGYRRRWWEREHEQPFPDWKTANVPPSMARRIRAARGAP